MQHDKTKINHLAADVLSKSTASPRTALPAHVYTAHVYTHAVQRHVVAPDYRKLVRVTEHAHTLAHAYYFTRNNKYAAKAATKLRTFFLDKQTGMLPHLLYAQLQPDVQQGSPQVRPRHSPMRCSMPQPHAIRAAAILRAWVYTQVKTAQASDVHVLSTCR